MVQNTYSVKELVEWIKSEEGEKELEEKNKCSAEAENYFSNAILIDNDLAEAAFNL